MSRWHMEPRPDRSARAVVTLMVLALILVAAVPLALLAAVITMLLGHIVGGLALFGGSGLAAALALVLAGMTGMHHLRKVLTERSFPVIRLNDSQFSDVTEPDGHDQPGVVQLSRSEYTDIR
jgi:uncharacterized membrane protein